MKSKVEKCNKIYNAYMAIENDKDLRKANLHLADWNMIPHLFGDLMEYERVFTFIENIARWFEKQGCNVKMSEDGVNYEIAI